MEQQKGFDSWAIVELFGHQRIAGHVTEAAVGGCSFLRVDVPAAGGLAAYTKFLTQGAIYCMTPTDEATARAAVERFQAPAINSFILPRALPAPPEVSQGVMAERIDQALAACDACEKAHIPRDSINRCEMCKRVAALADSLGPDDDDDGPELPELCEDDEDDDDDQPF